MSAKVLASWALSAGAWGPFGHLASGGELRGAQGPSTSGVTAENAAKSSQLACPRWLEERSQERVQSCFGGVPRELWVEESKSTLTQTGVKYRGPFLLAG